MSYSTSKSTNNRATISNNGNGHAGLKAVALAKNLINKTKKSDSDKKFSSKMEASKQINVPMMKMLFDYFNILQDDKKMQDNHKIFIEGFSTPSGNFTNNLPTVVQGSFTWVANFRFEDMLLHFTFDRYMSDGQYYQVIALYSNKSTYVDASVFMKLILKNAIINSDLKGKYLFLPAGPLTWEKKDLEKRGFEDIFLPNSITEDLEMFPKVYDKKNRIMRYLLVGNPGTGKTESVLAIANVLKNKGVTIIKTMVCEHLKEKMELAEMLAPCLVIMDDLDMYLGSRKSGLHSPLLGQFLDVLDGTEKVKHDVGIIATTNAIELLDIASSRPGRFDRILSFDDITKNNIYNIIVKSFNYNFQIKSKDKLFDLFTNKEIVELFHSSKVTGSHIYNAVKMLKLRIDVLSIKNITSKWVMDAIKEEIKMVDRIRNTSYLNDKFDRRDGSGIGFKVDEETVDAAYDTKAPSDWEAKKEKEEISRRNR